MNYVELKKYFDIDEKQIDKFLSYLSTVNKKMNLTSIVDKEEMILKHVYDSLLISKAFEFNNKKVLDIGSGGGFPGIPLAIYFPKAKFALMEATKKKALFLEEVVKKLGLKNVDVISVRAEECLDKEKYDVIISRALAELPIYLELAAHLCKVNGNIIALKGSKGKEELDKSVNAMKKLHLKLIDTQEEKLPVSDDQRLNFIFQKIDKTPSIYPRLYGQIKKKPL